MRRQGLLSDSGYQDDNSVPATQRFVPPPALSAGTHQIQNGRITSKFFISPEQDDFEEFIDDTRQRFSCKKCVTRIGLYFKVSSSFHLLIIAFCLAIISISLCCYVKLVALKDEPALELSAGDQISVTKYFLSSTFCDSIEMSSDKNFSAHRLIHEPKLQDAEMRRYKGKSTNLLVTGEKYIEDHYSILAGSSMDINIKLDFSVLEFYIIAGEENWETWMHNPHCDSCFEFFRPLGFGEKDDCFFHQCRFRIDFPRTDKYYFAMYNPFRPSTISDVVADIEYDMNRTLYDITSLNNCTCVTSCELPLSVFTSQSVMVEHITYDSSEYYNRIHLNVHCVPRHSMYFVAFAVTPFLLWISALLVVCLCNFRSHNQHQNEWLISRVDARRAEGYGSFSSHSDVTPLRSRRSYTRSSFEYSIPEELINHI